MNEKVCVIETVISNNKKYWGWKDDAMANCIMSVYAGKTIWTPRSNYYNITGKDVSIAFDNAISNFDIQTGTEEDIKTLRKVGKELHIKIVRGRLKK